MQLYILLRFVTWRAFSFWNAIAFVTDTLLLSAFILRVISVVAEGEKEAAMRLRSFQVLSCVSPFIWWVITPLLSYRSNNLDRMSKPATELYQLGFTININRAHHYLRRLQVCNTFPSSTDVFHFVSDHRFTRYIGTMQICVARMLKESGIFFAVGRFVILCPLQYWLCTSASVGPCCWVWTRPLCLGRSWWVNRTTFYSK